VARAVVAGGKDAVTKFQVLAVAPDADLSIGSPGMVAAPIGSALAAPARGAALVRCEPLTGRTHQIRLHLAHAGHPIVGDDLYGVMGPWIARQALHAASLTLTHPTTGLPLVPTAPLPADFVAALQALGLEQPGGGRPQE
jgi:23S rRNA-/tRNA-specific pseudouridylate synthase